MAVPEMVFSILTQGVTPDQMSSIAGSMSIACWLVVYSPQIWENYQLKSGEGLSVAFIVLWLLGDLTGLLGAVMAKLVPTVIILATYYTICDIILLFQVYYYRRMRHHSAHPTESSPLLPSVPLDDPNPPPSQPKPLLPPQLLWLEYPALITFVLLAGLGAWFLTPKSDGEIGIPENPGPGHEEVELEWKSQILGWTSAVLYFGSRIPQIIHNFKTRCAGLSLAMFFFTITGNVTYSASILLESTESRYLIANASWLAGALLTVFLDLFVMGQFFVFSYQDKQMEQSNNKLLVENDDGEGDDIGDAA